MVILTYDAATGALTGWHEIYGDPDADIARAVESGQGAMKLGIEPGDFYVDLATGALTARPAAGVAVDRTQASVGPGDEVTLSGLVPGAVVRLVGPSTHEIVADEPDLILTFGAPGRYDLTVAAFPRRDFATTITVLP